MATAISDSVADIRLASTVCSRCGWGPRQSTACEHCGHADAPPKRLASPPQQPPAGASLDSLYGNVSQVGQNRTCTRCSGPLDRIDGNLQCGVCGPINPTVRPEPAAIAERPADTSHLRCYGRNADGEPCDGARREAVCGFDRQGRMMPAKLVCPNCGDAAEPPADAKREAAFAQAADPVAGEEQAPINHGQDAPKPTRKRGRNK